jgi:xanthine dehydrogenase YagT iron-sulfur-binding subunit
MRRCPSGYSTDVKQQPTRSTVVDVEMVVNGQIAHATVDPRATLLDTLREHLGLTGAKKGCDHGQCGSCTVLVGGRRINSCLMFAVACEGAVVTTVEGLAVDGRLHAVQEAFLRQDAYQCGYCTPGQVCSAVGMLDEVAKGWPSAVSRSDGDGRLDRAEVVERMSGNICRCGAYANLVPAILEVAG